MLFKPSLLTETSSKSRVLLSRNSKMNSMNNNLRVLCFWKKIITEASPHSYVVWHGEEKRGDRSFLRAKARTPVHSKSTYPAQNFSKSRVSQSRNSKIKSVNNSLRVLCFWKKILTEASPHSYVVWHGEEKKGDRSFLWAKARRNGHSKSTHPAQKFFRWRVSQPRNSKIKSMNDNMRVLYFWKKIITEASPHSYVVWPGEEEKGWYRWFFPWAKARRKGHSKSTLLAQNSSKPRVLQSRNSKVKLMSAKVGEYEFEGAMLLEENPHRSITSLICGLTWRRRKRVIEMIFPLG